jgi:hypothetical protein
MQDETDQVRQLLQECTARISVSGQHAGTGFFVGPGVLLTCAHVVANDQSVLQGDVVVEWRQGDDFKSFPATAAVAQIPQLDLALVTITGIAPNHPTVWLSNLVSQGEMLTSYGYPTGYEEGDEASFVVEGASVREGYPLLKFKDGQADWGASGSPLLNNRLRSVCGVLTLSRNVTTAEGGRATPIELAFKVWPELLQLQAAAHLKNRLWANLMPLPLWYVAQSQQRERIFRDELNQRESVAPLPMADYWKSFIGQEPWHEYITRILGELNRKRSQVIKLIFDVPRIPAVDCSANYDGIVQALRPIVGGELSTWIQSKLNELNGQKQSLIRQQNQTGSRRDNDAELERVSSLIHLVAALREPLEDLSNQTKQPSFERCLLVLGDMGSGKTHFLASLLLHDDNGQSRETLVLLIRPRSVGQRKFKEYLLGEICERTGVQWKSLKEFDDYLSSFQPRPIFAVAVDDLQTTSDSSDFLEDLTSTISEHTQLHSFYWVITLDHQAYLQVAESSPFWKTYGYIHKETGSSDPESHPAQLGSWLQLDDLNWQQRTGVEIVRKVVERDPDQGTRLVSGLDHVSQLNLRHLTRPFIAWVLLDIRGQLTNTSLVDLNFIDFISKFWEMLLPRITTDGRIQKRLKTCVSLVTSYLMEHDDLLPPESELLDFVAQRAKGKSDLSDQGNTLAAVRMLERGGVLRAFDASDPELGSIRRIELTFDVFWNWNLAERLRRELEREKEREPADFLERWFKKYAADSITGSGILEFFLLSLEEPGDPNEKPIRAEELWRLAALSRRVPPGSVWFAASKIHPPAQDRLATLLLRPLPPLRDQSRDLFGFIYFLASLATGFPEGLTTSEIFGLLKGQYLALKTASLSDYFVYTVRRCLPCARTIGELVETMVQLDGCEVLGVAEEVANLSINALQRFESKYVALTSSILQYLRGISHAWLDGEKPSADRYFYREWVINIYCQRLLDTAEIDAYQILSEAGWYRAKELGINTLLAREMIKEANFAFGDWYRGTWPSPLEEYVGLVSRVAESANPTEREAAFFMIRHTRATHKEISVLVDPAFRPVLARIACDPDLSKLTSRYREFFRVNEALT